MNLSNTVIVLDSSADTPKLSSVSTVSVPLKIITAEKEFTDGPRLNVGKMISYLKSYSGKSSTSCPNPSEFENAFGDAEYVFCITITGSLSGSYNSALAAKKAYEEKYPDRHVHVINSLSTGPELVLIAEKIEKDILAGETFERTCENAAEYAKTTGLIFMLESLKNLANNGRVSPLTAKMASVLGIRLVGKASNEGTLEPLNKCRGIKKALASILENMKKEGFCGGRVKIAHCNNENAANALYAMLSDEFGVKAEIYACGGLCSFYAEEGGMLIGFEKSAEGN